MQTGGLGKNAIVFDRPFAYVLNNKQIAKFCSFCLHKPEKGKKLFTCSKCRHARYCDQGCQRLGWLDHKQECGRLQKCFPNLPLTECMFLGRVIDKVLYIEKNGDKHNWFKYRKFDDLLGHEEEIKAQKTSDPEAYRYEKILGKMQKYFGSTMPPEDFFFKIFCKSSINSHSIHNSSSEDVGMALDLGVSRYNHCCRPNASLVFDGYRAMIRSLVPNLDLSDCRKSFISYIDVGRSRYRRRKELQRKWFFLCECERCMDPEDDRLTSIKCTVAGCPGPVVVTEDGPQEEVTCSTCSAAIDPEYVRKGQKFMIDIPAQYKLEDTAENIAYLKGLLLQSQEILHPENIYYGRLLTAYTNCTGGKDSTVAGADVHKLVCNNFRRCFPAADRHMGYQLINIVQSLIQEGRREEAVPYAYEAMTIFEVCFGLEHPFYLQTLALWTYLENGSDKSNEQLLSLTSFENNKLVNIGGLLHPEDQQ